MHAVARCACAAVLALLVVALMWPVAREILVRAVMFPLLQLMAMPQGVLSYPQERQHQVPAARCHLQVVPRQLVRPARLKFVWARVHLVLVGLWELMRARHQARTQLGARCPLLPGRAARRAVMCRFWPVLVRVVAVPCPSLVVRQLLARLEP